MKNPIDTAFQQIQGQQKTSLTKLEDKTVLFREAVQEKGNVGKNENKDSMSFHIWQEGEQE